MTARCWMCGRPRGPAADGLGSHCRRKLAHPGSGVVPGQHTRRSAPVDHPTLEDSMTDTTTDPRAELIARLGGDDCDEATAQCEGCAGARALVNAHTAATVRARDEQFAAWLLKKARESANRQESTADYLARLADKVTRGAIR